MTAAHIFAAVLILAGVGIFAWLGWFYARRAARRAPPADHYENAMRDIAGWRGDRDPSKPLRALRRWGEGEARNPGVDD